MTEGIYILGNDGVYDQVVAVLNSILKFGKDKVFQEFIAWECIEDSVVLMVLLISFYI